MTPSRLGRIRGMSIKLDGESCFLCIDGHPWRKVLLIKGNVLSKYTPAHNFQQCTKRLIHHKIKLYDQIILDTLHQRSSFNAYKSSLSGNRKDYLVDREKERQEKNTKSTSMKRVSQFRNFQQYHSMTRLGQLMHDVL